MTSTLLPPPLSAPNRATARAPPLRSDEAIDRKKMRFMGQNAKYAYMSMERAIADADLKPEQYEEQPRVGGILGQAVSQVGLDTVAARHACLPARVSASNCY